MTNRELEQSERTDEYMALKRNIREIGNEIMAMLDSLDEERAGERELEAARGALHRMEEVRDFVREFM